MDSVNVPAKFEVCSFTRSWDNSGYLKTSGSPWIRRSTSRSSKVVDFGTSRKRVCNFLLVRHTNLGPVLQGFRDIAVCCAPEWPHPYSTLILGVFPLHQIAHVGVSPSRVLFYKLFGREIIYEVFQVFNVCEDHTTTWQRHRLWQTDGRTDGQTDRQTDDTENNRARAWHRAVKFWIDHTDTIRYDTNNSKPFRQTKIGIRHYRQRP